MVTLNDLTGWALDAATTEVERLGLFVNPVESDACIASDPPIVASMSAPGDIAIHSTIDLIYCVGTGE